ncbi:DUF4328 domain-containing protein [Streptomyces sp. NPDC057705]|uniref:DUF4328 domain-containing protein n=1 Tax=Streptomyces sp. NPDC057705 TaxID=3346222 RepID=UPI003678FB08
MSVSTPGSPLPLTPAPSQHSGPPPRVDALRSPQGLATALTVLLWVAAGVNLLSAGVNVFTLSVTAGPAAVADGAVDLATVLTGLAGIVQLLSLLGTAAVFLVWFYRVRVNGEIFRAEVFTQKRGWAIGGWFIPLGHMFLPFWTARETWRASTQLGPDGSPVRVSTAPLTAWWVVWVVAALSGRLASALYDRAETPEELGAASAFGLGSDLLMVAAAVLAVRFVRRLTAMQHTMAVQGPYAAA